MYYLLFLSNLNHITNRKLNVLQSAAGGHFNLAATQSQKNWERFAYVAPRRQKRWNPKMQKRKPTSQLKNITSLKCLLINDLGCFSTRKSGSRWICSAHRLMSWVAFSLWLHFPFLFMSAWTVHHSPFASAWFIWLVTLPWSRSLLTGHWGQQIVKGFKNSIPSKVPRLGGSAGLLVDGTRAIQ